MAAEHRDERRGPGRPAAPAAPAAAPGRCATRASAAAGRSPSPATSGTITNGSDDQRDVEDPGARVAEAHGQRSLAGHGVAGDVTQVVDDQQGGGQAARRAPTAPSGQPGEVARSARRPTRRWPPRRRTRRRTARRSRRSRTGCGPAGVEPAGRDRRPRHHEQLGPDARRPARARPPPATPNESERRPLHRRGAAQAPADQPHRTDPRRRRRCPDAVAVVVGVVGADLEGQGTTSAAAARHQISPPGTWPAAQAVPTSTGTTAAGQRARPGPPATATVRRSRALGELLELRRRFSP